MTRRLSTRLCRRVGHEFLPPAPCLCAGQLRAHREGCPMWRTCGRCGHGEPITPEGDAMCRSKAEGGRRCAGHTFRATTKRAAELARVAKAAKDPAAQHETLFGGQSAATELITTADGSRVVHKSARDTSLYAERADTRFEMDGEVLASELAEAVGAPIAAVRRDGPEAVWVEYVAGSTAGVAAAMDSPEAVRIGLVDAMSGYQDRASGLLVTDDGRLMAFDNGGSWHASELTERGISTTPPGEPYLREPGSPMAHFVTTDHQYRTDPPISTGELAGIRTRVEALRPKFEVLGRGAWLDSSLSVLDQITAAAGGVA